MDVVAVESVEEETLKVPVRSAISAVPCDEGLRAMNRVPSPPIPEQSPISMQTAHRFLVIVVFSNREASDPAMYHNHIMRRHIYRKQHSFPSTLSISPYSFQNLLTIHTQSTTTNEQTTRCPVSSTTTTRIPTHRPLLDRCLFTKNDLDLIHQTTTTSRNRGI